VILPGVVPQTCRYLLALPGADVGRQEQADEGGPEKLAPPASFVLLPDDYQHMHGRNPALRASLEGDPPQFMVLVRCLRKSRANRGFRLDTGRPSVNSVARGAAAVGRTRDSSCGDGLSRPLENGYGPRDAERTQ
jgi:hypothetical protein